MKAALVALVSLAALLWLSLPIIGVIAIWTTDPERANDFGSTAGVLFIAAVGVTFAAAAVKDITGWD